MCIISASVPYRSPNNLPRRSNKPKYPWGILLRNARCIEDRRWRTIKNSGFPLSDFSALCRCQPFESFAALIKKLDRLGIVLFRRSSVIDVGVGESEQQNPPRKAAKMPQHDVPCDVLMDNRHDMERRAGCRYHQAVDNRDADRAESAFVSKAKPDLKSSIADYGAKCLKGDLSVVWYIVVSRQFANARAVDRSYRRK